MTDLAVREDATASLSVIHQTASDLSDAHRLGTVIASTAFAPAHFRGKPEECAIAILYGDTIGLDPMNAIQQIFVIGGKPALYARAMVAIVLAAGHELEPVKESDDSVTVKGRRRGSNTWVEITWTIEMARRAGYTSNKKYQTDPRSMLYARASGDVARRIAPDALLGMAYTVEEMQLEPAEVQIVTAEAFTPPPTMEQRDLESAAAAATPEEMITPAQVRKLAASLRDLGLTGRAEALDYATRIVGRSIATRNDLTKVEAGAVIDAIDREVAERNTAAATVDSEHGPVDTDTGELQEPPADDTEWPTPAGAEGGAR